MEEKDALKTYLLAKLENCGPRDATQKTMICRYVGDRVHSYSLIHGMRLYCASQCVCMRLL